ncbi:CopM family metallochaperone [Azospirillum sp. sgz302134]
MTARRLRSAIAPLGVMAVLLAGPAAAQQAQPQQAQPQTAPPGMMEHGPGMHQQGGQRAQATPKDPASRAYMQSMRKMNQDMHKPMTGNADQDFARMMAAHHQGAIDMARVQLQYGQDPELKAMAQKVIDDQTKEVQQLQDWIRQHPAKPASK